MTSAGAVTAALGSPPVAAIFRSVGQLRVLAYHGVPDPDAFRYHARHIARHYNPVTSSAVVEAVRGERELPRRAVWVTFDDGIPDVIDHGMPVLEEAGIRATMFVCPSVIDTDEPLWWQIVDAAAAAGVGPAISSTDGRTSSSLKRVPDEERRVVVERLQSELAERGTRVRVRQLTSIELQRWADAGHSVGSHTWDHPCLDKCDEAEQCHQIERADEKLARFMGNERLFAYPNGNWSASAELALRELGYTVGLVFDHRMTDVRSNALRMSRLRVDADAPPARFRAIVSGGHSTVFNWVSRVRRLRSANSQ